MAKRTPSMAKPLVLAVVLCTIGGFAYWLEYGKKPKEQQAEADAKKVFVLRNGAVAHFEIRGASTKPELAAKPPLAVALDCTSLAQHLCKPDDASKWEMREPLATKADDTSVNSLLKNFGNLASNEAIDLGTETPAKRAQLLKDYGLDAAARANPATRRVTIALDGGPKYTAYFGVKHPIGDNVFALLATGDTPNENRILVVPDWQISIFDQKTSYFRDKSLFGLSEREITSFTLAISKNVTGKLEGARAAGDKGWTIRNGGQEYAGDVDTVDAVLSGVVHLAAKDVVAERRNAPEAKAVLQGAKPIYDLAMTTKSGVKHLHLYEKKKDAKAAVATIYAVVDDQDPLYEIDVYGVEKIQKSLADFRVGKLIGLADRYAITAIDIDARGPEAFKQQVTKDAEGHWKVGGVEAGRGKVEGVLDRLSSKIVTAYLPTAPSDGRLLKMTFRKSADAKTPPVAELEIWSGKGKLYARDVRSTKKEVFELATDFNSSLPWTATSLFDTKGPPK